MTWELFGVYWVPRCYWRLVVQISKSRWRFKTRFQSSQMTVKKWSSKRQLMWFQQKTSWLPFIMNTLRLSISVPIHLPAVNGEQVWKTPKSSTWRTWIPTNGVKPWRLPAWRWLFWQWSITMALYCGKAVIRLMELCRVHSKMGREMCWEIYLRLVRNTD